jgi:ABC-type ATPase with predicted acetyltransferase domain
MSALKICVVGPKGTCKTVLSNFLAGQSEKLVPENYEPTAGESLMKSPDSRSRAYYLM